MREALLIKLVPLLLLLVAGMSMAEQDVDDEWEEVFSFDDAPLEQPVHHPPWFRLSFLHLQDDLEEAIKFKKRGIIVYFGQKYCPYCQKLMDVNFGKPDISRYTRDHFDVIAIDIHGDRTVTDFSGLELSEKEFAEMENTNFTPSLIFYDRRGKEVLRLRGYHPPYKFRAALEFAADGHYRTESFRDYLERADPTLSFQAGDLIEEDFFSQPPYALDRSRVPAELPLVVFFEQADCHACDVLHTGPLQNQSIQERLGKFEVVQLDMWGDTPVITPDGQQTTSREWAEKLELFYAPTVIFFDENGKEIIRVDSVVRFYRLRWVLDYIASGVYRKGITIQRWRRIRAGLETL